MDAALVINGVVDTVCRNVDIADLPDPAVGEYVASNPGEVFGGFMYSNGQFTAPAIEPRPVPVPEEISDRQFFEALATVGLIPRAEAIAAVSVGAVPTAMEAFFAGMDADAEFKARMLLQGAITFHRHHPLVEAFGALQGMNAGQIDDLWRLAAGL